MNNYLEFKTARCKDCYKCLRECPVKAIRFIDHQAVIIDSRCVLCGNCTRVCPQDAKHVHSDKENILKLLASGKKVIASVAPSFVSSFGIENFSQMRDALIKLGFADAQETSIGAKAITDEYRKMLESGKFKNLITSACPAINRMIQLYYPEALPFLAPCDTPMIAHAKIIKKYNPEAEIVFVGPCIAKKREGAESDFITSVLTFEELNQLFDQKNITISQCDDQMGEVENLAKNYPISRGIIKSFGGYVHGYEFVAISGLNKCRDTLENLGSLSGMFLELNSCEYACVNGPCSMIKKGSAVKANGEVRRYANKKGNVELPDYSDIDFSCEYKRLSPDSNTVSEEKIKEILARTGKVRPEDELNCGACGYATCREKAWAVACGYADIEMCVPYMRERAESLSSEIIKNSPNGIILFDMDLNIQQYNGRAVMLYGIDNAYIKGIQAWDLFDASEYSTAVHENKNIYRKKVYVPKTNKYVELSVILLKKQKAVFGVLKDITEQEEYYNKLNGVKLETLKTTDEVIKKQMRVAQEIASLLGETTAESKIALLKLKKTFSEEGGNDRK